MKKIRGVLLLFLIFVVFAALIFFIYGYLEKDTVYENSEIETVFSLEETDGYISWFDVSPDETHLLVFERRRENQNILHYVDIHKKSALRINSSQSIRSISHGGFVDNNTLFFLGHEENSKYKMLITDISGNTLEIYREGDSKKCENILKRSDDILFIPETPNNIGGTLPLAIDTKKREMFTSCDYGLEKREREELLLRTYKQSFLKSIPQEVSKGTSSPFFKNERTHTYTLKKENIGKMDLTYTLKYSYKTCTEREEVLLFENFSRQKSNSDCLESFFFPTSGRFDSNLYFIERGTSMKNIYTFSKLSS